jgi:hypothetical protein
MTLLLLSEGLGEDYSGKKPKAKKSHYIIPLTRVHPKNVKM